MKRYKKRIISTFLFLVLAFGTITTNLMTEEVVYVDGVELCVSDDSSAKNASMDSFFCTDECDDECVSYHWYIGPETSKRFYNKNMRENAYDGVHTTERTNRERSFAALKTYGNPDLIDNRKILCIPLRI